MEEIIIDGVNVAGCVRFQEDKISCDLGGECKGWENCYYKQLKRLEQENARLKENDCEQCKHLDLYIKYKQTLQKIKKYIAKICKEECGYVQKKRCPDCDCRFGAILDLITKVEEE